LDGGDGGKPYKSAFLYFIASTSVCAIALAAFFYLLMRERHSQQELKAPAAAGGAADGDGPNVRRSVSMWALFRKLRWLALAVFTCFGVTMVFPVFTKVTQYLSLFTLFIILFHSPSPHYPVGVKRKVC
jgi:equilibrative nucleoside transporter 1/2/3